MHFSYQAREIKKMNPPGKKFLIFQEMELSNSNIKKFLIFQKAEPQKIPYIFSKKTFSHISRNKTLHFSDQAQKTNIYYILEDGNSRENFLYFLKKYCSFILGNRNPKKNSLYFRKRNSLKFQGMQLSCHKLRDFLIF